MKQETGKCFLLSGMYRAVLWLFWVNGMDISLSLSTSAQGTGEHMINVHLYFSYYVHI